MKKPLVSGFCISLSVLVAARAMDMSVLQFVGSGIPDFNHFHFKVQFHACEGMITIHRYGLSADFRDRYSFPTVGAESHTRLYFLASECIKRHLLDELRILFPVTFGRGHFNVKLFATLLALQSFFHSGDQISDTLDII